MGTGNVLRPQRPANRCVFRRRRAPLWINHGVFLRLGSFRPGDMLIERVLVPSASSANMTRMVAPARCRAHPLLCTRQGLRRLSDTQSRPYCSVGLSPRRARTHTHTHTHTSSRCCSCRGALVDAAWAARVSDGLTSVVVVVVAVLLACPRSNQGAVQLR